MRGEFGDVKLTVTLCIIFAIGHDLLDEALT